MSCIRYLLLLIFCKATLATSAQQPLITGDFKNVTIEEFVKSVEKQTKYTFYFDRAQFDSFYITASVKSLPLFETFQKVFLKTEYFATIDSENHIFLTKGTAIATDLPWQRSSAKKTSPNLSYNRANDQSANSKKAFANDKLYFIGAKANENKSGKVIVSGYVLSSKTKEPVAGSTIKVDDAPAVATTDSNGKYSIAVLRGRHVLTITSFGNLPARRQVVVYGEGTLPVEVDEEIRVLQDVTVSTQRNTNINRTQMGMEKLNIKSIKQVPAIFGEADVLRVILTLPGVKSVGEASTGFNVRGGASDQNLILFNDATIYNPSHFFGFFSAFNPDIIKDVELYKSSIPAKYGGRLSSVLNITSREGNKSKFTGTAGVGLLTSRINIEGPIIKDKTSFILGARTTYANWLLKLLPESYKHSSASFYDVNLLISHKINAKNDLYFTGYVSADKFSLNNDTGYGYQNKSVSLKWKHSFNSKLESALTAGYDGYTYNNSSTSNKINAYKMSFDVNQINVKGDFTYTVNEKHLVDFGVSSIRYTLNPGSFVPVGTQSLVVPNVISTEQALESAVYASDRFDINNKLSISGGVRYSLFNYLGPQSVNIYAAGLPKDENSLIKETQYGSGKIIKTYQGAEIRFSTKYSLSKSSSIKVGYNTLRQYIHMLSNTTAISPTDIWKLSDYNIRPQFGDQISLGLFKNFGKDSLETSVEVYYKRLKNILDYRSGAQLVLNPHIETDVINTKGKAYGVEFMIKKRIGKLNGWLSYTYSRTLLRMDDANIGPVVNGGKYYPANYDKPHDATLVGNYAINHRFSLSLNVTYSTGRPITLPIGRYYYSGSERALYSNRNEYRIPDYFRSDFSMNIDGNHKIHQFAHNSFTIGVYNLTGRKNPYSVYYTSENGVINGYKLSIFGSAIPFINYNIRF